MNKADLIKNTYLFRGIAASDLSTLATIAEERDLTAGNLIYDAGQDSDAICSRGYQLLIVPRIVELAHRQL